MDKKIVLVKYGEIGLKGKNKNFFVNRLVKNIKVSCDYSGCEFISVDAKRDRIVCEFDFAISDELIISSLKNVCGLKSFSFAKQCEKDIEKICELSKEVFGELIEDGVSVVNFKTKRGDKKFPLKSPEINNELIGVAKEFGLGIDFKNKENVVFTEISDKGVFMYSRKFAGIGGLPVGTSGKVLQLLSGGIDSPVSAFCMMKRGCIVDFLHFHSEVSNEKAFEMKVRELSEVLNKFQFKCRLILVPYSVYEMMTMGKIHPRYELVFFKHYILKVADKLALRDFCGGVVTGDSLAQVASQTLDNMRAVSYKVELPIYRPLLTLDKDEIVDIAREIGTFELSTEQYKDCCSIHSKNPLTAAKMGKFCEILEGFDLDGLVDRSIEESEVFIVNKLRKSGKLADFIEARLEREKELKK